MATEMKRLTFTITKEMEPLLDRAKKDMFNDYNQSEMIRILITAGLDTLKNEARIERPLPSQRGRRQS